MTVSASSAFAVATEGKADMPFCTANVAYDPKRTSIAPSSCAGYLLTDPCQFDILQSGPNCGDRMQFDLLRRRGCHHAFRRRRRVAPLAQAPSPHEGNPTQLIQARVSSSDLQ